MKTWAQIQRLTLLGVLIPIVVVRSISVSGEDDSGEEILPQDNDDINAIVPIVRTPAGTFQGVTEMSRKGRHFYTFKGIPYAEPPGRFQPATLKKPMNQTYDARYDRSSCPQQFSTVISGEENCLFLSASFPHPSRCGSGRLPVMFFIHPGSFKVGSGSLYQAEYLLDECIVFVSINHRLGALGFLSTGDDIIPGNLGLKDQVVALQWVKNLISYFRGDPNRVTIFGISSGAASVSHHILSPSAAGLFHNAIASSGSVLLPWAVAENPKHYAQILAMNMACPDTNSSEAIRVCLLEKDYEDIVKHQDTASPPDIVFGPIIEPPDAVKPYQSRKPYELLVNGEFSKVPFMVGFVQDEGASFGEPILQNQREIAGLNAYWSALAPVQLFYDQLNMTRKMKDNISNQIRTFYFQKNPVGQEQRRQLVDLISDRIFVQGTYDLVEFMAPFTPTYLYVNTYKGGKSFVSKYGWTIPGITHSDDSQLILPTKFSLRFPYGTEQFNFSRMMVQLWTNFAKNGRPSGYATQLVPWKPMSAGSKAYHRVYNLDMPRGRYLHNYLRARTRFWRNLGLFHHEFRAN